MDKLRNQLKIAFASTFTFYIKAHGYHWNVEGPEFYQLHKMFEKIYTDVYKAIDPMAEHLRALGTYSPFSLKRIMSLSVVEDDGKILTAPEMLSDLRAANTEVIDSLNETIKMAQTENQQGLINFLADRIDKHQKWGWFLTAASQNKKEDTNP